MKAKKLTPAEERQIEELLEETLESYAEELEKHLRARLKMKNGEPFEDFSNFFVQCKVFNSPNLRNISFFNG